MMSVEKAIRLADIGLAAVEVDRVRQLTAEARERRQSYETCEHERRWNGPACWKRYVTTPPDRYGEIDQERLDESEWCANCLARQAAHERFVVLRNKLGGMRAGLARRCTYYRKGGE